MTDRAAMSSDRLMAFRVDDLDAFAIELAIKAYSDQATSAFGELILPEGDSDDRGAILGEICRDWLEQRGKWPGEEKGT